MAKAYTLEIRLLDIEPGIWRRVVVPGDIDLGELHDVIQIAMGWTNSHLHEFRSEDRSWRYSDPFFEMEGTEDEFEVMLRQVAPARGATFTYVYDMGDYWEHRISVVDISKGTGDRTARCLAGERACPPEDVGGTSGYEHFLQVIADPRDEEYAAYAEWMPEGFDPERFDLAAINKRLATMEEDLDEDDLDGEDAIW